MCQVEGCVGKVVSNGLCDKHRKRLARHGKLDTTRPARWGEKENHPLYDSWYSLKRSAKLSEEWLNFWSFVEHIKERKENHVLKRKDESVPFGNNNYYWKPIRQRLRDYETPAAYMREHRKLNPILYKRMELKKRFNLSLEEYEEMKEAQNNLCAICGNPETLFNKSANKVNELSVDHCHKTGKIRGLLCNDCNHAIGKFKDNPECLQKALEYLTKEN